MPGRGKGRRVPVVGTGAAVGASGSDVELRCKDGRAGPAAAATGSGAVPRRASCAVRRRPLAPGAFQHESEAKMLTNKSNHQVVEMLQRAYSMELESVAN